MDWCYFIVYHKGSFLHEGFVIFYLQGDISRTKLFHEVAEGVAEMQLEVTCRLT